MRHNRRSSIINQACGNWPAGSVTYRKPVRIGVIGETVFTVSRRSTIRAANRPCRGYAAVSLILNNSIEEHIQQVIVEIANPNPALGQLRQYN